MAARSKASDSDRSSSSGASPSGAFGRESLSRARLKAAAWAVTALVLAALTGDGLIGWQTGWGLGGAIRPDPFTRQADILDRLLYPLPHPALREMPYVPAGARGTLIRRPASTGWLNSPSIIEAAGSPGSVLECTGGAPPAAASDSGEFLQGGLATHRLYGGGDRLQLAQSKEAAPEPQQQQAEPPQQQQAPAQSVPSGLADVATADPIGLAGALPTGPHVLAAACLSEEICWMAGEEGYLARSLDGGRSWDLMRHPGGQTWFALEGVEEQSLFLLAAQSPLPANLRVEGPSCREAQTRMPPRQPDAWLQGRGDSIWRVRLNREGRVWGIQEGDPRGSSDILIVSEERGPALTNVVTLLYERWLRFQPSSLGADFPGVTLVQIPPADAATYESFNAVQVSQQDRAWAAGDRGALMRFDPLDIAVSAARDTGTAAALRDIRFAEPAPGETEARTGWVSSGWYDGNEEGDRPVILQTTDGGESWQRLSYRHWPAPWAFLTGFLALLAGAQSGASWRDYRTLRRRVAEESRIIGGDAASDSPIGWDDADVLGLKPIASALSRFVRNLDTQPPVTFGITGPWGTGKSSLMRLVADDLRLYGARPVMFNAWHHQTESHLLASLLEAIRSQGLPPWYSLTGLLFRAHLLIPRLKGDMKAILAVAFILLCAWLLIWLVQGSAAALLATDGVAALLATLSEPPSLESIAAWIGSALGLGAAVIGLLYGLFRALRELKVLNVRPAELMARYSARADIADLQKEIGFRHRFEKQFGAACRALRSSGGPGMVIFIDDLDRCRPENVLVVLEAVNFLVTSGPCFVFLGIDEEKVVQAVALAFKDSILIRPAEDGAEEEDGELKPSGRAIFTFAEHYLEKLVNISVPIPAIESRTAGLLLGARAEDLMDEDEASDGPLVKPRSSTWPRRLRASLRQGSDMVGGLLPIALLIAFLGSWAFDNLRPVLEEVRPQVAAEQQGGTVEGAAPAETPAAEPPGTTENESLWSDRPAPADPDNLDGYPRWWLLLGMLVAAIALIVFAARRIGGFGEGEEFDRPEFQAALKLWLPLIHAKHPTPRSIKRFQNHTRFLATLQRREPAAGGWLARIFGAAPAAEEEAPPLDEQTLVTLHALHDFAPQLFRDFSPEKLEAIREPFTQTRLLRELKMTEAQRQAVHELVGRLQARDVMAFLALRPSVTSVAEQVRRGRARGEEKESESSASPPSPQAAQ